MTENRLGAETSPYLLQHKDNPVHWRAWGDAALAESRAQNKPVLLSVGYAACHWCHVMAQECFENADIAALMNNLFIPIKVDREERPDIDAIYMQALAMMGEQTGWPLTMFLTPDGQPFWGGTYFPPTPRWGRPGFPDILRNIAAIYHDQADKLTKNIAALSAGLQRLSEPRPGGPLDPAVLDPIARRLASAFDPVHGGIAGSPKFPQPSILDLIWRGYHRTKAPELRFAVLNTLDHLCQGGIYDHLGGGFARYSTDEAWLVPHFEKMLYDNAQLIELLCAAWQDTGAELYRLRVEETIIWLLRDMIAESGGFAATVDADSEHEEGKFYVWTEAEIDAVLGKDAGLFKAHYDVTSVGNWEGKIILTRMHRPILDHPATEAILAACRAKLFQQRETRIRPGRDDKVLADWNGLMIAALVHAAEVFDRPDWLDAALSAWRFITTKLMSPDDRLAHSWRLGRSHPGVLDDYAALARAGLRLDEATGDPRFLAQTRRWVEILNQHYRADDGSYYFTADDTPSLITRTRSAHDSAVPSGNGLMVEVLARLGFRTGDSRYSDQALALVEAFSGEVERNFYPLAAWLNGVDLLAHPVQIVIIGARNAPDTLALRQALAGINLPNRVLTILPPDENIPQTHPAFGKTQQHNRATAYICIGQRCSAPVTDPEALLSFFSSPA